MRQEQKEFYKVLCKIMEAEANFLDQQAAAYGELRDLCMEDNDLDGYRQNGLAKKAAELRAHRVRVEIEEFELC